MISDTSPIIFYAKINRLQLLVDVVKTVIISDDVYQEAVIHGSAFPDSKITKEFLDEKKITVTHIEKSHRPLVAAFTEKYTALDNGEAETMVLALQEKEKEVLMDEEIARKVARLHGLTPRGTLWVLGQAYQQKRITEEETKHILGLLLDAGLWVSADVLQRFYDILQKIGKTHL